MPATAVGPGRRADRRVRPAGRQWHCRCGAGPGWEWAARHSARWPCRCCAGLAAAWRLAGVLHGGAERAAARHRRRAGQARGRRPAPAGAGPGRRCCSSRRSMRWDWCSMRAIGPCPGPALAAPALLLLALAWLGDRLPAGAREERLLAAVCAVGAVLVAVLEGPANAPGPALRGAAAGSGRRDRVASSRDSSAGRSQQRQRRPAARPAPTSASSRAPGRRWRRPRPAARRPASGSAGPAARRRARPARSAGRRRPARSGCAARRPGCPRARHRTQAVSSAGSTNR